LKLEWNDHTTQAFSSLQLHFRLSHCTSNFGSLYINEWIRR